MCLLITPHILRLIQAILIPLEEDNLMVMTVAILMSFVFFRAGELTMPIAIAFDLPPPPPPP